MAVVATINRAKYDVFRWRHELSIPKKLALSLGMVLLTALVAQVKFPLPWTPVPITGQTFAVLLAGVLLGSTWGGISMAMYAVLGFVGVPVFAGWSGGFGVLTGATGGYIIGFILAAFFLGYFTDKFVRSRSFVSMLVLMLFANFVLIYVPGLIGLSLFLGAVGKPASSFMALLGMGMVPFIAGDITKAVAAAAIARGVTPKQAYNGEVDKNKWATWRIP